MPAPKGITIPARVAERAFNNWEPSPSGCRISTYSTASHGYAQPAEAEEVHLVPVDSWPDYRSEKRKQKGGDHQ